MLSKLQIICEQRKNDSSLTIGDIKTLKKAKKTYEIQQEIDNIENECEKAEKELEKMMES